MLTNCVHKQGQTDREDDRSRYTAQEPGHEQNIDCRLCNGEEENGEQLDQQTCKERPSAG